MDEMMETSLALVQRMQWSHCLLSHIVASYSIIYPCNSLLQVNFECLPFLHIYLLYSKNIDIITRMVFSKSVYLTKGLEYWDVK